MLISLVVVDDFNRVRVPIFPDEADAPLVIDTDAMLAAPLPLESFEPVPRWHPQVIQDRRR